MHICNCLLAFRFWETCPKKQNLDSKFLKDFSTTRNVKKKYDKSFGSDVSYIGNGKQEVKWKQSDWFSI